VRDTDALIRGGIRKLLRALGYAAGTRAALPGRLRWYLDPASPEKPDLDWDDPSARAAHLVELVEDARTTLALAGPGEGVSPAAAEAAALLAKIVADDVETEPPPPRQRRQRAGQAAPPAPPTPAAAPPYPRRRQGVAPDRTVSVVDPAVRVGHTSRQQHWAG
jgi:hypothetical protein